MSNFPIVVSFYTKNSPYEELAAQLKASCDLFGLKSCIEGVDSFGSWEMNCAFKPFFLHQKLEELKQKMLWVDADGLFVSAPTPLDLFDSDFAVRINDDLASDHPSRVISNTIFVNATGSAQELLRAWAQGCLQELMRENRTEEFWEQTALRDLIFSKQLQADVRPLPLSYTKISGHPFDEPNCPDPVIVHHQASRLYKRFV